MVQNVRGQTLIDAIVQVFQEAPGARPLTAAEVARQLRERGFWGGYFLSGANVMASATRQFPLSAGLFFSLDGRLSATYVRVPVSGGHASVPNVALHFHAGLGYSIGGGGGVERGKQESP